MLLKLVGWKRREDLHLLLFFLGQALRDLHVQLAGRDVVERCSEHALKYDSRPTIARHLAARMRAAGADLLETADLVVPVPLHRSRERARGFNQARELARHLGRPCADALARTRKTPAQADLPAVLRYANVRGAFGMTGRTLVARRTIVLVDDVSTTGATLNACAAALLEAGAKEIRALTAAKAVAIRP